MKIENLGGAAINTAVFAVIGLAAFGIAFWLIVKIAPFSVKKEDQNRAIAIITGVLIGISFAIAAAIRGG